jgi:hypothetical protein
VSGALYAFERVERADDHRVEVSELAGAPWTEGAEDAPAPRVVDATEPGYELLASVSHAHYGDFWRSGSKAFRLGFASTYTEDSLFELDRELVTGSSPTLRFHYRRGLMYPGTAMTVETSVDGGLNWQPAGPEITGNANRGPDAGFRELAVNLPPNRPSVRVRFRHDYKGGSYYAILAQPSYPVGIFVDDITVSGVEELAPVAELSLGPQARSFRFGPEVVGRTLAAGEHYRLRLSAVIEGHEFPPGPARQLTITGSPLHGFDAWAAYQQPALVGGFDDDDDGDGVGNGAEYAFATDPVALPTATGSLVPDLQAGVIRLCRELGEPRTDVDYGAEWSTDMAQWSTSGVVVSHVDGELVAEVPLGNGQRFLRWRIERR